MDTQCKDRNYKSNIKAMNYNQATLYAATGKILMLPGCMDISIGTMVLKS